MTSVRERQKDSEKLDGETSAEVNLINVRRSVRDPSITQLEKSDFKHLIDKIKTDSQETVVFKLKNHLVSDINAAVLDTVFECLLKNKVCQALYVQNLSRAFGNDQLNNLILLLKKKPIWCLNIGENYEISNAAWVKFCDALPDTSITHLYVSEHVISIDLKNKMRAHIRENRKKHDKHCSMKNLSVIERCTNMWWNPINGVKELRPPPPVTVDAPIVPYVAPVLTPAHTAYWQEGVGLGGDQKWKFNCSCGETCSSYENFRYHPIGRMYECSKCSVWSHVSCVLGEKVTEDDLEEMTDLMCNGCHSRTRRELKATNPEGLKSFELALKKSYNESSSGAGRRIAAGSSYYPDRKKATKVVRKGRDPTKGPKEIAPIGEDGKWKFKCICGQVCSWYEKPLYHPLGKWYECVQCNIWSHVVCMYGEKQTDEDMAKIKDALCSGCRSKSRRIRNRPNVDNVGIVKPEVVAAESVIVAISELATDAIVGEDSSLKCVNIDDVENCLSVSQR